MQYEEAKRQFIQTWGRLGTEWGINRTMAQIHALLLISPDPLSAEEIMGELSISRGNANMNLRDLIDWGLVSKEFIPGERKEFFVAEKDVWEVAKRIARERKRRELEPVVKVLDQLAAVDGEAGDKKVQTFVHTMNDLKELAGNANKAIETMLKAEENWFFGALFKIMR